MESSFFAHLLRYTTYTSTYPTTNAETYPWSGHRYFADMLVREYRPEKLVELGTHYGVSFFAFCQAVAEAELNTQCYAIDSWQGEEHAGFYSHDVYDFVEAYTKEHYAPFAHLLRTYFDDAVNDFAEASIDILHIDGFHSYEAVKHDFETWLPKVKPGGIVLFHDACVFQADFGVHTFWSEIEKDSSETRLFTHSNGLGVWRKPGGAPLQSAVLHNFFHEQAFFDYSAFIFAALHTNNLGNHVLAQDVHLDQDAHLENNKEQCVKNDLAERIVKIHAVKEFFSDQHRRCMHEIEKHKEEIEHKKAHVTHLEEHIKQETNRLNAQIEQKNTQIQARETDLKHLHKERAQEQKEFLQATERDQAHIAHLQGLYDAIIHSKSWRLTAPLRFFMHHTRIKTAQLRSFMYKVLLALCLFPGSFLYYPSVKAWFAALCSGKNFFLHLKHNSAHLYIEAKNKSRIWQLLVAKPLSFSQKLLHCKSLRGALRYQDIAASSPECIDLIPGLVQGTANARAQADICLKKLPDSTIAIDEYAFCLYGKENIFYGKKVVLLAHWDPDDRIDPYVQYLAKSLKSTGWKVILSSASKPCEQSLEQWHDWADAIVYRTCQGYDFTSWKAALELFPSLYEASELVLTNDSYFGPFGSFEPMHVTMDSIACDFWGITENRELQPHLQSYYLVLRASALQHEAFKMFMERVPLSADRSTAILFEINISLWLASHGLQPAAFIPASDDRALHVNPVLHYWQQVFERGAPLIKRDLLKRKYYTQQDDALRATLTAHRSLFDCIVRYFWRIGIDINTIFCRGTRSNTWPADVFALQKAVNLDLYTNSEQRAAQETLSLGLFIHVYYTELLDEICGYLKNIPQRAHLHVSTDCEKKAATIRALLEPLGFAEVDVRVFPNVGWDIAPFFVGFAEKILNYDIVLKFHAKRSSNLPQHESEAWREMLFTTLMGDSERVTNILSLFAARPDMGLLAPPPVNFATVDFASNFEEVRRLLQHYHIDITPSTALDFPVGTMFWCRPAVLKPWLDLHLTFADFERTDAEKRDGTLAHALERVMLFGCGLAGCSWGRIVPQYNTMQLQLAHEQIVFSQDVSISEDLGQETLIVSPQPQEQRLIEDIETTVKAIAFYLPQFHTFPENEAWWGKGFTEWTNVRRSRPMFAGHIQPEVPHHDVGYYDLANPEVLHAQAKLAKAHGIHGFCFHHYRFSGKRLMEKPVDALLADPSLDMPFCLNWANENWTRRWDGLEEDVLIAQEYSAEDDDDFMHDLLRYLADPRYIRVHGRPLFMVYRPDILPDMRATLERWRTVCRLKGEAEPYFVMVQSFANSDPQLYGFDAAVQFPPHGQHALATVSDVCHDFSGYFLSFERSAERQLKSLSTQYTHFPCVFPSWDNTPRRLNKASIYVGSTPQKYENWLTEACRFVQSNHAPEERFVFINAWNEWAEGAHLEPCEAWGYAYLNATTRALNNTQ